MDSSPRQTLDQLANDLAEREGELAIDDDYELPTLEPLNHNHPLLSATTPEFDVERFLLSRSHISLSDLRVELRDYLSQLKEELVRLINDDYEAFISLSTDLRGEGARLEQIHAPVHDLREEIRKSASQLIELEGAVQAKLAERVKLREEKALLRLLFNISDSLNRLESLLLIPSPEDAQQDPINRRPGLIEEDYDQRSRTGHAKHLSRVASEYVQLLYHADKARAEQCVYVSENQWRIDRIRDTVSRDLDQLFGNALQSLVSGNENSVQGRARVLSDLSECFKTYDLLGLHEEAEEIIRTKIVQPFVKRTIYTGALDAPHSPIVPRTPFIPSSGGRSVPATPFTPYTAYPQTRANSQQSSFFLSEDNSRLPLLDDSDNPLATLYNNILQFIEKNCLEVMQIAARVIKKHGKSKVVQGMSTPTQAPVNAEGDTIGGFEIMSNVVWAEIGRALMDQLGALIFAAGKPAEFKANYTTSKGFLSALEYLAPDLPSVQSMRGHPIYATFERRWQLPVYFQLRWKEIVGNLENSLNESRVKPSSENSGGSHQAAAVVAAISRCWSSDVFLAELGHRFWKLTLQIIKRYENWLQENMPFLDAAQLAALRDERASLTRSSTPPPRTNIPQGEGSDVAAGNDDEKLGQLSAMMTDVKVVVRQITLMWHEEISACAGLPENVPLEEILRESLMQLEAIIPDIAQQLVMILTRRCCEPVEKVRQVPTQIRNLGRRRDALVTPSPFMTEIFKPLRDFFGMSASTSVVIGGLGAPPISVYRGAGKELRNEYGQKWATEILQTVSSRYTLHLESMRKNEEAIRRLKRGAGALSMLGFSSNAEGSKDEDRIRAQMVLDVQCLGQDAEAFGVDPKSVASYAALVAFVEQTDDE